MENISYAIFPSAHSFPLDGGRPVLSAVEGSGWGCERNFRSPLPLSSPVRGEEIRNRTSVNRIRTHRRTNSIILFFVIGLLFVSTHVSAQLKKIRLCAPGLGSGIMHAYVAKVAEAELKKAKWEP